MRYRHFGILAATFLAMASHATTVDYIVSTQVNGFDVYKVTKDGITLMSSVSVPKLTYVWNDIAAGYIYAVYRIPATDLISTTAEVITYAVNSGVPKQVAKLTDAALGNQDYEGTAITGVFASPQHLVMTLVHTGPHYPFQFAHVYHKEAGGTLKLWCDLSLGAGQLTNVRIDPNEIYAYLDWTDTSSSAQPVTAIYDISINTCNYVGQIPQ